MKVIECAGRAHLRLRLASAGRGGENTDSSDSKYDAEAALKKQYEADHILDEDELMEGDAMESRGSLPQIHIYIH